MAFANGPLLQVHFYRDASRGWRWRLIAHNGRIMADSAEAYTRKRDCEKAFRELQVGLATAATRR